MLEKLKSRKLLALVLVSVLTTLNGALQLLSSDMMELLIQLTMVYIGGQAAVDSVAALKASTPPPA